MRTMGFACSWYIKTNSTAQYFLTRLPNRGGKKKLCESLNHLTSHRKCTLDGGHVAESDHDWNDVKGTEFHSGCGNGLGIGRLTAAEEGGDSSGVSPWKRSLEDIPGDEPHGFADLPAVGGPLVRNSFNLSEELVLLVGVREADEVPGVGAVGEDGDASAYWAAALPDPDTPHQGRHELLHALKLLLGDIPGLVQGEHQFSGMHWAFRFS